MSDPAEPKKDNVIALAAAFDTPAKEIKGVRRAKKAEPAAAAPKAPEQPPVQGGVPVRLPEGPDCPVTALGTMEGVFFYTDSLGQVRAMKTHEHGRLHLIDLFGGTDYLNATWPVWYQDANGTWQKKDDFAHGKIAPVLMSSCSDKGIFDPANKVRGCGSWIEDSGALVMHCGRYLWRSEGPSVVRDEPQLRDGLLYPRRPALPEPDFEKGKDPGGQILDMLLTWNWKRGDLDAMIVLAWIVAALLGQAPPWRPIVWMAGGRGTGKSTLRQLIEWIIGTGALIAPENTSQAYIYQTLGDSSLPVLLDEFEAKEDNRVQQAVIELMRLASSKATLGRGGSENNPKNYTIKSCFAALSILIPPLSPQDRSRMAICELKKLRKKEDDLTGELDLNGNDDDIVLGARTRWAKAGKQLRARVLMQWPRYMRTYKAYFTVLMAAGHDHRAAQQFASLGAAYDIAMFDSLTEENVRSWAARLPPADVAETKGYENEPEGCLKHLLAATPDLVRKGTHETVSYYLREARREAEADILANDSDTPARILAKTGIKVYRDPVLVNADGPVWWVAVASSHPALAQIYKNTHWKGRAGTPGTWAQALRGLPGVAEKAIQMRIDGKWWVTRIPWDSVFPPFNAEDDADEIAAVAPQDRQRLRAEDRALHLQKRGVSDD